MAGEPGRKGKGCWVRVIRVAVALALALVVLLMVFESKLIYFPTRYPTGNWELPAATEDVTFRAADGVRLHGWWMTAPNATRTVLYAHGNGGNITTRREAAIGLRDLGMNVLIFDYRGYGKSEGSPSESGLYMDHEAALEFLTIQGVPPGQVVLFGESLGTAVVAEMAAHHQTAAIILEAPFTDMPAMARRVVPIPLGWLMKHRFDTLSKAPRFTAPLMVIHGTDDDLVPYAFGRRVFEAAPEPKRFYSVQGAHHNDIMETAGANYFEEIGRFVDSIGGG